MSTETQTELKEGPDLRSETKLTLQPGEKVLIIDSIGEWNKVSLSNKQLGWIADSGITKI